jgi:hypothetical protein
MQMRSRSIAADTINTLLEFLRYFYPATLAWVANRLPPLG